MQLVLTTELLLEAYRQGLFPMAYSAGSPYVHWVCPEQRGQLSIPDLHIPKRLLKTLRHNTYEITVNKDFRGVIAACAEKRETRPETWINDPIMKAYIKMHEDGHAHSLECWKGAELVGGIYGIAIGKAFFGESMFSRATDASKIALVHLTARLWRGGFTLFDTQFVNDHIKQFGAYEVPHKDYMRVLRPSVKLHATFVQKGVEQEEILREYLEFRNSSEAV